MPFALLLVLLTGGIGHAEPAGLLRAAEDADRRLSYTGIRTVRAATGREEAEQRVRVWHLAPDRTRIEYLSPKGGNALLEIGTGRWFYSRRRGTWWPIEWRPSVSRFDLLLQNYHVRRLGSGTVGGRRVVQLSIEPRHPGNPVKKVWIDLSCRMVLREEVRDSGGRLIASSAFERFELVRELPAERFEPPSGAADRAAPLAPPFPPARPRYVPPGYQEVRRHGLRRGPNEGVHLRYTDGLGTISLFQFRRSSDGTSGHEGDRGKGGRKGRHGSRDGGQRRLVRQVGDLHCSAMGDIAPEELRKMLDSL